MQEPDWAETGLTAAEVGTASKYWATIVAELQAQQTLTEANRHMVIRLVLAMITYEETTALVQREGSIIEAPKTKVKMQHPALSIANKQLAIIRQLEGDLGLTPGKRAAAAKGKVPSRGGKKKPGGSDAIEF
ncbi:phage terminase small subunit P27 family [Sandarakinorhabdus sp.]|uniref:phage terminase small subunit P27 family n=1 Tax=Sandarakinorhabdus sp. TaxID=1916663 RepID=UPI00286E4BEC|nr:phage terminase small subunit P27 family [Sandarakinorhabdus sp.]